MSYLYGASKVRGALHEKRGVPCEDACGGWSDERGETFVIVVADGHGDPTCVRSAAGARIAVDVAMGQLQKLAALVPTRRDEIAPKSSLMRRLASNIADGWRSRVLADLRENPLDPDEGEGLDWQKLQAAAQEHPTLLYGTTLVAALVTSGLCVFVQQGDGCCGLIAADGKIWHPVPDDELCVGNLTTSLSDDDAADRMRIGVVKVGENSLLGCFVASDGVEKSYYSEEDLDGFFRYLATRFQGKGQEEIVSCLKKALREVSDFGSQDDASVACVMNTAASEATLASLQRLSERQRITSELDEVRSKLVSMQRKHAILEELWTQGREDEAKEYPAYHASWQALVQSEAELAEQLSALDL